MRPQLENPYYEVISDTNPVKGLSGLKITIPVLIRLVLPLAAQLGIILWKVNKAAHSRRICFRRHY